MDDIIYEQREWLISNLNFSISSSESTQRETHHEQPSETGSRFETAPKKVIF